MIFFHNEYRTPPRSGFWSADLSITVRLCQVKSDNGSRSRNENSYSNHSIQIKDVSLIKYISDEPWTLTSQTIKCTEMIAYLRVIEALDGVKLLHKTSTIGKNNITITICQISSCPNFD